VGSLGEKALGFPDTQTISAGVYEVTSHQKLSSTRVLTRLDEALYRAKNAGRNRVERGTAADEK
jgi:PleD family two-component response regulator